MYEKTYRLLTKQNLALEVRDGFNLTILLVEGDGEASVLFIRESLV